MLKIDIKTEGEKTILVPYGDLTIENAEALRDALLGSFKNAGDIVIDPGNITSVDLSCLQLLCSAHKTADSAGTSFEIKDEYPEVLRQAAEESGYLREYGCQTTTQSNCLWKKI